MFSNQNKTKWLCKGLAVSWLAARSGRADSDVTLIISVYCVQFCFESASLPTYRKLCVFSSTSRRLACRRTASCRAARHCYGGLWRKEAPSLYVLLQSLSTYPQSIYTASYRLCFVFPLFSFPLMKNVFLHVLKKIYTRILVSSVIQSVLFIKIIQSTLYVPSLMRQYVIPLENKQIHYW
jgi:hypothetical protein